MPGVRRPAPSWQLSTIVEMQRGMTDEEALRFLTTGETPADPSEPTDETTDDDEPVGLSEGDVLALLAGVPIGGFVAGFDPDQPRDDHDRRVGVLTAVTAADDSWKTQLRAPRGTPIGGQWVDEIGGMIGWIFKPSGKPVKPTPTAYKKGRTSGTVAAIRADGNAILRIGDNDTLEIHSRKSGNSWELESTLTKSAAHKRVRGDTGEEWHEPDLKPLSENDDESDGFVERQEAPVDVEKIASPASDTAPAEVSEIGEPKQQQQQLTSDLRDVASLGKDDSQEALTGNDALNAATFDIDNWSAWTEQYGTYLGWSVNSQLRGPTGATVSSYPQTSNDLNTNNDIISALDQMFSEVPTLDQPITVVRGVSNPDEIFGKNGTGIALHDAAFMSTTTDESAISPYMEIEGLRGARIEVTVPRGGKAVTIFNPEGDPDEIRDEFGYANEILIPRNTTFDVTSDETDKLGNRVIKMTARPSTEPPPPPPQPDVAQSETATVEGDVIDFNTIQSHLNAGTLKPGDVVAARENPLTESLQRIVVIDDGKFSVQRFNSTSGAWSSQQTLLLSDLEFKFSLGDEWLSTLPKMAPSPSPSVEAKPNNTPVPEAEPGLGPRLKATATIYRKGIQDGEVVAQTGDGERRLRWDEGRKRFISEARDGVAWNETGALTKKDAHATIRDEEWYAPKRNDLTEVRTETSQETADVPGTTEVGRPSVGRNLTGESDLPWNEIVSKPGNVSVGTPNEQLDAVLRAQGFDALPELGSAQNLDDVIANGGVEVFRGVDNPEFIDAFKRGELFTGYGYQGSGTYATTDRSLAESHAGQQEPMRMVLKPDARVLDVSDVEREQMHKTDLAGQQTAREEVLKNRGAWAAARGYDAVDLGGLGGGEKNYLILNRGALLVEDDDEGASSPLNKPLTPDFDASDLGTTGMQHLALVSDGTTANLQGRGDLPDNVKFGLSRYWKSPVVNRALRGAGGNLSAIQPVDTGPKTVSLNELRQTAEGLDAGFALPEARLDRNLTVHRGIGSGREAFGDAWSDVDMTGASWRDNGYTSTSLSSDLAGDFATTEAGNPERDSVVLRILTPTGTPVLGISGGESEVLLPRGSEFTVVSDNGVDAEGFRHLDVTITTSASPEMTQVPQDVLDTPNAPTSQRRPGRDLSTEIDIKPTSITPISGHRDGKLARLVAQQTGWNDPAQVVSSAELDDAVAAGWTEIFRGVTGDKSQSAKRADDMRTGTWYMGNGIYGNGSYASTRQTTAFKYAGRSLAPSDPGGPDVTNPSNPNWGPDGEWTGKYLNPNAGSVVRMALDPSARVITWNNLREERDRWMADENVGDSFWTDPGRFAALRGYDAILLSGDNYDDGTDYPGGLLATHADQYILLNRSALMMEESNVT